MAVRPQRSSRAATTIALTGRQPYRLRRSIEPTQIDARGMNNQLPSIRKGMSIIALNGLGVDRTRSSSRMVVVVDRRWRR